MERRKGIKKVWEQEEGGSFQENNKEPIQLKEKAKKKQPEENFPSKKTMDEGEGGKHG